MTATDELVWVVPRAAALDGAGWHGVRTGGDGLAAHVEALTSLGRFEPRAAMEHDPTFKQVIPYLVLRDGSRYFLMRRTRAGRDTRLHDRWSIGVGGHVNPGDGEILGGLRREWREELEADFEPEFRLVGLLNDDTTDVGRVHIGVVYVAEAAGRAVRIRETEKLDGSFAAADTVRGIYEDMETWSQLAFDVLEASGRHGRISR